MKYFVFLQKCPDSDYGVTLPDVPGCYSAGRTVDEALANAKEALALHFEGLVADGEELPQAQSIDQHLANQGYVDGVWGVIEFDVTPYFG